MNREVLIAGSYLKKMPELLGLGIIAHSIWEIPDWDAFLRVSASDIRIIVTDTFTGADAQMMAAFPNLEAVVNLGVGYEKVDVAYARSRGVQVSNTPGVLDDDVADLAIGLMLAVRRRMVQADRFVREGGWNKGMFPLTHRLSGARLGIVGLGRIGKAVARRALGFGLDIAYHGRHEQADQPYRFFPELFDLAAAVDFLVVLVPDNATTRKLISREVLSALSGNKGILINVARGPVVDEAALVELLVSGQLGGAGLDVFENEPQVPAELLSLDTVVLQPHVGSATTETRQAMMQLTLDNLQACFRGEPLLTPVW